MVIGVMKVAIIGLGFVGLSFAAVLGQKNFPVLGIDIDQEKILKIKKTFGPFCVFFLRSFPTFLAK